MAKQTTEFIKKICDDRVTLVRLNGNPMIYARAYIQGKDVKYRTEEKTLKLAEEKAHDWWEGLRAKDKRKESVHGRLFSDVADAFIKHAETHQRGEISDGQIDNYTDKWKLLKKLKRDDDKTLWFDGVLVTDIDLKFLVDLREKRSQRQTQYKRNVSASTLKKDMDFVRLVMRFAKDVEKCLNELPAFPKFQGKRFKVANRPQPALTMKEYNTLVTAARTHANEPTTNTRTKRQREQLLAFIQLSVMGGLRPSEAYSLRWMDCKEVTLNKRPAIQMWVEGKHFRWTGKREEGYAIYQGVAAYRRLKKSCPDDKRKDSLFDEKRKDGVAQLLEKTGARTWTDEDGVERLRTSKCFRPTGISMWLRLSENPNLNDARKIFRTSVKEIEQFYDQNPVRSAASRMSKWKGEPKDLWKSKEVVVDDTAWEREDDETPDAVPGELVDDELDEVVD